ncbi:MAG: cupin domain-containing protein [Acidimicrobiales bacterium]|jgi:mannose-6-phosphate isomerase-like protein (cupin superfamily)
MEPIRLVVTGHDGRGRATVVDDAPVEPITLGLLPGFETIELWHTDTTPAMPEDLGEAGVPHYFPPPGGSVFRVVTFPPEARGELAPGFDFTAALDEAQAKVPDLVARLEPDSPGMHTTDSVDYAVVLDGRLELELDDGATTTVGPGTVVVQRGTRHGWRNRTDRPARIAFVLIGATPAG